MARDEDPSNGAAPSKPENLPRRILIGLGLGILTGLFFGEECARFQILGEAYVGILQMPVLPYVAVTMLAGLGRLDSRQLRLLAGRVSLVLLLLWGIGFAAVALATSALPSRSSASFFSNSQLAPPVEIDLLDLFIPSNPFGSLAAGSVPAVVAFCILLGLALSKVERKAELLAVLDQLTQALSQLTKWIVSISPFGVFVLSASAAGTITFEDIGRLQAYLLTSTLAVLGLAFWLLPLLVVATTRFRRRDILPLVQSAFILAFATGKTLVVLPMVIEGLKKLFAEGGFDSDETGPTIEILIPLAYSFPHLGRIVATLFIPFAAWYAGTPLEAGDFPSLFVAALFAHFASSTISIPFLLDFMHLPADLFQVFLLTHVYTGRLEDGIGATHLLVFGLMGTCAVVGATRIRWRSVARSATVAALVAALTLLAARSYLSWSVQDEPSRASIISSLQLLENPVSSSIVEAAPNPFPLADGQTRLERIRDQGLLRVGFQADSLPFAYCNDGGELVGLDIELVHRLARDLGVRIEFIAIEDPSVVRGQFQSDYFDLVVGGVAGTLESSIRVATSNPYMDITLAFIVRDHDARDFRDLSTLRDRSGLQIGVLSHGWFSENLGELLPDAQPVVLGRPREFFEQETNEGQIEALLYCAEAGSAWTLLYPDFQVSRPDEEAVRLPLVIAHAGSNNGDLAHFIDRWIDLKKRDGTIDRAYDHWILGEGARARGERWSVLRDVLGWVE